MRLLNGKDFPFPETKPLPLSHAAYQGREREAGLPPHLCSETLHVGEESRVPQLSPPNHTNISVETSLSFLSNAPQQIPIKLIYPHL